MRNSAGIALAAVGAVAAAATPLPRAAHAESQIERGHDLAVGCRLQ